MTLSEALRQIKSSISKRGKSNIKRFGLSGRQMLGVTITDLRAIAKSIGTHHALATQLWKTGIHEARILAGMIADVNELSEKQIEFWVKDFDSWDLVDETCLNLFCDLPDAFSRAAKWTTRKKEFEKRAGFALVAYLAWYRHDIPDDRFVRFLKNTEIHACDERNFVKKAVNWALRQIGKRNKNLNQKALLSANRIRKQNTKSAKWIATDALRELKLIKSSGKFKFK